MTEPTNNAFRQIPYMGVIYVVAEAMKLGFYNGHPDWCNLGQGQPEVGPMEGAPERYNKIEMEPQDHAYGHINGTDELCEAVAAHYNRLYRQGKSQYTAENVSVASGGRLVLTRVFAALKAGYLGYQIPDYTAYEDMINYNMPRITPKLVETRAENGFAVPASELREKVAEYDLNAYLFSNPCNPTGTVVQGDELAEYVNIARDTGCAMIFDEFYSHFIYNADGTPGDGPVSAASYVDDVNSDPVLLIDGLTKSFRYPGWRVGWAVGPKDMIETLGRAASAIDGGPNRPIQRAAIEVLKPERADQETNALREGFTAKRNLMIERLKEFGLTFARESEGTFYVWANISKLPAPFNNAEHFFREALKRKVMTVPGVYFDVNPDNQREGESPFAQWLRFSFGPPMDNVKMGLERLSEMLSGS
ncbi:MAG: pyridoxal phosphate-dependent aminotransferase [Planctomycetota bacterium]|jgi:aspartate/methionine/tyrosine aminotransferase